jgi:molybdopterin synthase sulfur carrier subunit
MKIKILYFAWVREQVGRSKETVETNASTVAELVDELIGRDAAYGAVFKDLSQIKVAVDHELSDLNTPLIDVLEVAFFPPMTGG